MKINEYGDSTTIYFENYDEITIPGLHFFEIGSEFKLADGNSVIIRGYVHERHQRETGRFGSPRRLGWVVQEIVGIGIVNPRGLYKGAVK